MINWLSKWLPDQLTNQLFVLAVDIFQRVHHKRLPPLYWCRCKNCRNSRDLKASTYKNDLMIMHEILIFLIDFLLIMCSNTVQHQPRAASCSAKVSSSQGSCQQPLHPHVVVYRESASARLHTDMTKLQTVRACVSQAGCTL